jgi:hypothetical protein
LRSLKVRAKALSILAIFEAVVMGKRMTADLLARLFGDEPNQRGSKVKRIFGLRGPELIEINKGTQLMITVFW